MEQTCKEMGLSMSAAFTVFATKVSREKRFRLKLLQTLFIVKPIWRG